MDLPATKGSSTQRPQSPLRSKSPDAELAALVTAIQATNSRVREVNHLMEENTSNVAHLQVSISTVCCCSLSCCGCGGLLVQESDRVYVGMVYTVSLCNLSVHIQHDSVAGRHLWGSLGPGCSLRLHAIYLQPLTT
jgi:hypothetical protein